MPIKVNRSERVTSEHVGKSFRVHTGRQWRTVRPTPDFVNQRFGGFVKTRTHKARSGKGAKSKKK